MIDDLGAGAGGGVIQGENKGAATGQQGPGREDAGEDMARSDLIEWLRKALAQAEERIALLEAQLSAESGRYELERLLVEAGAVDLETALVLAERRLGEGGVTAEEAVRALVGAKGFLFRGRSRPNVASAVSEAPQRVSGSLEALAREARESGDRRAVLRYLRGRRG